MMGSFLLEFLMFPPGGLLLLVLHLLAAAAVAILLEVFLKTGVELGDVDLFVLVFVAVTLGDFEGLLEGDLFLCFGLGVHLLVLVGLNSEKGTD
jgi:hypothetical protein